MQGSVTLADGVHGSEPLLAPEHKAVLSTDPEKARAIGRAFVEKPYLGLRNYVNNLLRYGFTAEDVGGGGSNRLVDALVLHGTRRHQRGTCGALRRRRQPSQRPGPRRTR